MVAIVSSPCEAAGEELNTGGHDPGGLASDAPVEVLGEAPVASEPGEGALDHPTARLRPEARESLSSRNDLDRPLARIGERSEQFRPAIDAVGEDVARLGEPSSDRSQQRNGAMIVLHVGRLHENCQQATFCVSDDVTLAALHFLGDVKPAWTTAFRGLHALTVDDAGGRHSLSSAAWRARSTRTRLMQCHVPSS